MSEKKQMTFQEALESGSWTNLKGLREKDRNVKKVLDSLPQDQITDEMWSEWEAIGELIQQVKFEK